MLSLLDHVSFKLEAKDEVVVADVSTHLGHDVIWCHFHQCCRYLLPSSIGSIASTIQCYVGKVIVGASVKAVAVCSPWK